jgi:signal transduction histidine kinase/CheY-like chemotaxis protein
MAITGRIAGQVARLTVIGLAPGVVCTVSLLQVCCDAARERSVRTNVQQVRDLSPDDVRAGVPVRLRGTVTYFDPWMDLFFVQDATGGIAVDTLADRRLWVPGQVVEISGIAGAGGAAPLVIEPRTRVIGNAALPAAVPIPAAGADLSRFEYRRASVSGMVHSAFIEPKGQLSLTMDSSGRKVVARVLAYPTGDFFSLVGAQLTVRGIASRTLDVWGHTVDLQMKVYAREDVTVDRPAVAPQLLPVRGVRDLQALPRTALPRQRVRIRGQRLDTEIGSSHLVDDGTGRIRVVLAPYAPSLAAHAVDLAGFPRYDAGSLILDAAIPVAASAAVEGRGNIAPEVLTEVRQFHRLTALEARREYPLHVRGTVTYFDPLTHNMFVQDRTAGTYVFTNGIQGLPAMRAGDDVDITGVTFPGDFAPTIGKPSIRVLGRASMPAPLAGDVEDVFQGNADSQWVELEGVIHGLDTVLGHALVTLTWGSRSFKAHIVGLPALPEQFRGARVRLRGVAGSLFNRRRQLLGIQLFVPGMEYMTVLDAAPADPFALPVRDVDELLQFSPDGRTDRLTHVRGVVTLSDPLGPTWIRGSGGALAIRDHTFAQLAPGDLVDVAGFPVKGPFSPEMHDAVLKRIGGGPQPAPAPVTADETREGNHDAELVRIDAILTDQINDAGEQVFHLQSGRTTFTARIADRPGIPVFTNGAVVRVTGICSVEVDTSHDIVVPRTFTLRMRSPADIAVIREAPWWTPERTMRALALTIGVVLLVLSWVAVLRRRVHRQTRVIAEKLAEEARLRDEAQAASRAKSEFLANVSHELRTPMNGIVGFTALALETELTGEQRDYLDTVRSSADSLLRIINDILDFSRTDAGGMELDETDFSLADCLRSAVRIVEADAARKRLSLRCEVSPSIPTTLRGDPERLRQIVLNLLSNAVKFTPRGTVTLAAALESESDAGVGVRISVADTGIGIPIEKQAVVFEPFRQADGSVTRKYGGTGLGLAISRNLVHLLGGEMQLESAPGQGSRFVFTACFRRPRQPDPLQPAGRTWDESAARSLSILVAEDNAVNRRLLITVLESRGHRVRAASNGVEAVEFFQHGEFDLILMDVQMPELDGIDATAAIRQTENGNARVPIYAFTAHAMAGDREKCLAAGMDGYLSKPVKLDDLVALVGEVAAKTMDARQPSPSAG